MRAIVLPHKGCGWFLRVRKHIGPVRVWRNGGREEKPCPCHALPPSTFRCTARWTIHLRCHSAVRQVGNPEHWLACCQVTFLHFQTGNPQGQLHCTEHTRHNLLHNTVYCPPDAKRLTPSLLHLSLFTAILCITTALAFHRRRSLGASASPIANSPRRG
jgi:hypothetical protein